MIDSLPDQKSADVDVRFAPRPEKIPTWSQGTTMRKFFPIFSSQKSWSNDVINFLFTLYNPVESMLALTELPMKVTIENLQPLNHFLQVDISTLSMDQKLLWVSHLKFISGIEG